MRNAYFLYTEIDLVNNKKPMTDKNKKPWYKRWWAIAIFIFFGIGILGNLIDDTETPPATKAPVQQTVKQVSVVFDLEPLYGKNIDEIRTILGNPTDGDGMIEPSGQMLELGTKEWSNTFEKGGRELLVTFNVASREIIDFFISTDDPSGKTKDTSTLAKMLNVENSTNYTIEPVKVLVDPSSYTGIKAVPKK